MGNVEYVHMTKRWDFVSEEERLDFIAIDRDNNERAMPPSEFVELLHKSRNVYKAANYKKDDNIEITLWDFGSR